MSDIRDYFSKNKEKISEQLDFFLNEKRKSNSTIPFYEDCIDKLLEFSDRGKMLRGSLVMISSGNDNSEDTVKIAAAIELIHTGLLIHDDIMDQDETRRGAKTIFAQYADEAKKENVRDAKFYGDGMAICCADIAFFLAFELLSSSKIDPSILIKVIKTISSEIQIVGGAQMGDFHFGETISEPTINEILDIYRYKSARYTFSLPLRVGSEIAKLSETSTKQLELFGEKLGIVFQMKDDEIGLLGEEKDIGKPVGSDIRQNKKTIFRTLLFQKYKDHEKLNAIFGKYEITQEDIDFIKKLVIDLGIKNETDEMVEKMSKEAEEILNKTQIDQHLKDVLQQLIEYNSSRSV